MKSAKQSAGKAFVRIGPGGAAGQGHPGNPGLTRLGGHSTMLSREPSLRSAWLVAHLPMPGSPLVRQYNIL